ncbi:sugar kinase [Tardisphaera miroshnichenkoae]
MTVFSLGEALVEFIRSEEGSLAEPGTFNGPFPSGAPAITASAVSRLGGKSKFACVVGRDEFGRAFVERMRSDGVDTSLIRTTDKRTTATSFLSYEGGKRNFLFHGKDSAAALLNEDDVDLSGISALHVSGSSLGMGWGMARAVRKAVRLAKEQGIPLSFDPNVRKELMSDALKKELLSLCKASSYLMLSVEDAAELFGDAESACASLSKDRVVILKMGRLGSKLFFKGEQRAIRTPAVKEVDATGAGDWYNGAFLAMIERGARLDEAATFASAAAAISVTKLSPMEGPSSKDEVFELMHVQHME